MNRARSALVGLFLIGGLLLFAVGLFLIGDRRLLFTTQFELYSEFSKVTGLRVGSQVRLSGLDAGEVLEIAIPSRPSERFRVRMRIREDVHPLVRTDSVASIQTDGIVGNAFVQVEPGTDEAPIVAPGATIAGRDPIEFADLIQEGRETFRTVTREFVELRHDISGTIVALTDTVESADGLIEQVETDLSTLLQSGTRAVDEVHAVVSSTQQIVADVRNGRGTIGQLFTDDSLYQRMAGIASETEETLRNVRETTERTRAFVEELAAPDGPARGLTEGLRNAIGQAEEVMADLAESTEALKRNFLFRGFFRERGFYDLDAISPEAYLAGALEGRNRTALRIWLDAAALFTRDASGREVLTEEGRRRIDSAMADFVRYPRDSPIVVEGYAEAEAGQAAYLTSADRASIVRDYLVSRFRRQARLVGYLGLSDRAVGSPRPDGGWSGVALTIFVSNQALAAAEGSR